MWLQRHPLGRVNSYLVVKQDLVISNFKIVFINLMWVVWSMHATPEERRSEDYFGESILS